MKTVILQPEIETHTVLVDQLDTSSIYVAKYQRYGTQIGLIAQQEYCKGSFRLRSLKGFTHANSWSLITNQKDTLSGFVTMLINDGWEVFQFSTFLEFAVWYSKQQPK